jgi:uncharacterized protein YdhG (YjbR/CyaY superfamily)
LGGRHPKELTTVEKDMSSDKIDEYIANQPEDVQLILQKIRSTIKDLVPEAEEKINYDIPAISLIKGGRRESQIMFAVFKKHIGFYPFPTTIEHFRSELDGFKFAKGSVQFPLNQPIPYDLISRMVQYRLNEILSEKQNRK